MKINDMRNQKLKVTYTNGKIGFMEFSYQYTMDGKNRRYTHTTADKNNMDSEIHIILSDMASKTTEPVKYILTHEDDTIVETKDILSTILEKYNRILDTKFYIMPLGTQENSNRDNITELDLTLVEKLLQKGFTIKLEDDKIIVVD